MIDWWIHGISKKSSDIATHACLILVHYKFQLSQQHNREGSNLLAPFSSCMITDPYDYGQVKTKKVDE